MKVYPVPQPVMQEVIDILQTLPWSKVNRVMAQLVQITIAVEKAAELEAKQTGNGHDIEHDEADIGRTP